MGMRAAALARHGVDRLDVVGPHVVQLLVCDGDDFIFADARLEHLVDGLVNTVDQGGRHAEQRDLVLRLDLSGIEHRLLAVHHLDRTGLQGEDHRHLRDVHAQRLARHALFAHDVLDGPGDVIRESGFGCH